jgi:hypothetical protein
MTLHVLLEAVLDAVLHDSGSPGHRRDATKVASSRSEICGRKSALNHYQDKPESEPSLPKRIVDRCGALRLLTNGSERFDNP